MARRRARGGGIRFWLIVASALLAGNLAYHTGEYLLIPEDAPEVADIDVEITGLDPAIARYLVKNMGFCGYLKQGGNELAILQNQIAATGETVTVDVVKFDYRLVISELSPNKVGLAFLDRTEK